MAAMSGTLEVYLESASGLRFSTYRTGSPYAIVSCGSDQQVRSRIAVGQGSRPIFKEQFRFRVDGTTPELNIRLFNQDMLTQDEELGSIRIPFANLFHGGNIVKFPSTVYAVKCGSSGQRQGDLRLSLSYTPHSAAQVPMKAAQVPMQPAHVPTHVAKVPTQAVHVHTHAAQVPKEAAQVSMQAAQVPKQAAQVPKQAAQVPKQAAQVPRHAGVHDSQYDQGGSSSLSYSQPRHAPKSDGHSNPNYKRATNSSTRQVPYLPSFRSNQGPRPEADLKEIASHMFTIPVLDWVKLLAKLDVADALKLEKMIGPENLKKQDVRLAEIALEEITTLMNQLDASDLKRVQLLGCITEVRKSQPNLTSDQELAIAREALNLKNLADQMALEEQICQMRLESQTQAIQMNGLLQRRVNHYINGGPSRADEYTDYSAARRHNKYTIARSAHDLGLIG